MRYELKYPIAVSQQETFLRWLNASDFGRHHPPRTVNSLYFDDLGLRSAIDNLAGISNREKCRIRWYGTGLADQVTLEIKRKANDLGEKEVLEVSEVDFDPNKLQPSIDALKQKLEHRVDAQAMYFYGKFRAFALPTLLCAYERQYFISQCGLVRLTVDANLVFGAFFDGFALRRGSPTPEGLIVELKADRDQWERIRYLLRDFAFLQSRNSKYLQGLSSHGLFTYF